MSKNRQNTHTATGVVMIINVVPVFCRFSTPNCNVPLYHTHTTLNDVKKVIKKFQSNFGCALSRSYALVRLRACAS